MSASNAPHVFAEHAMSRKCFVHSVARLSLAMASLALAIQPHRIYAEQPFEYLTSFDGGLDERGIARGWIGTTPKSDQILVSAHFATAIFILRPDWEAKSLTAQHVIQNPWSAKDYPLAFSTVTPAKITYPHNAVVSADGRHVYSNGNENVEFPTQIDRDGKTGTLVVIPLNEDQIRAGAGLPPAQGMSISPDGKSVYAVNWHTLMVFERNAETGRLKLVQLIEDDSKGTNLPGEEIVKYHKIPGADVVEQLRGAHDSAISPDGRFVYVASRLDKSVSAFSRNVETGRLTHVQALFERNLDGKYKGPVYGLRFPTKIVLSHDGQNVYVSTAASRVVVFKRNLDDGKMTHVQTVNGEELAKDPAQTDMLKYCVDLCVSPDGRQVYVACSKSSAIVVFNRDALQEGRLSYLTALSDKALPAARLRGVCRVCTTADGKYLLSLSSDALVSAFRRTDVP
jgi:DNA-binding beta-propeller fold protein YncE